MIKFLCLLGGILELGLIFPVAIVLPWIQEMQLGYGKFNLGYVKFRLGYGKFKGKQIKIIM